MHIPSEMLNGTLCPVSAVLASGGVGLAVYAARCTKEAPTPMRFAAVAALIFAGQMANFPVQDGTSGHLLGGLLATALLGLPFGVLALALVVALQALVFADGGLAVLGCNVLNMAIIGAGGGALVRLGLQQAKLPEWASVAIASVLSILAAAAACSLELSLSGAIAADKVFPAMLSVHARIGLGEALITLAALAMLKRVPADSDRAQIGAPALAAFVITLLLAPFASASPDGLEWVAERYHFLKAGAPSFVAPIDGYLMPGISDPLVATALAGAVGVALTLLLGGLVLRSVRLALPTATAQ